MMLKKGLMNMFSLLMAVLSVLHLSCGRQSGPPKQDNTPPTVISFTPNTGPIKINESISVTFSEPVDEKTIAFSLNALKVGGSVSVPCTMKYSGTTAIFTPDYALDYSTTYNAKVGSGFADLSGNASTNETIWSFLTDVNPDTTPPRVVNIQPFYRKTDVSTTSVISIQFSEPVDMTTISKQTIKLLDAGAGKYVDYATLSYNEETMAATFKPNTLDYNKVYNVFVTTGVKDLAGLAMTVDFVSSFTTVTTSASNDITPPSITSAFPINNALNVNVNAPIGVIFSEPIDASTILPINFIVSEGSTIVTGSLRHVGKMAIFTPDNPLKYSTSYNVIITKDVTDLAGNSLSSDYTWSFMTGAQVPDTEQPSVLFTFPSDPQNNVPVYQQIVALFSEKMLQSSITQTTFELFEIQGQTLNRVTGLVITSGAMAIFTPSNPLRNSTFYTVTILKEVADLAGNEMGADYTNWSFTTEPQ